MILKKGIELHGFDSSPKVEYDNEPEILYQGKLSNVTESQAREFVENNGSFFRDYSTKDSTQAKLTARGSLKSATSKEWVIITSHDS